MLDFYTRHWFAISVVLLVLLAAWVGILIGLDWPGRDIAVFVAMGGALLLAVVVRSILTMVARRRERG